MLSTLWVALKKAIDGWRFETIWILFGRLYINLGKNTTIYMLCSLPKEERKSKVGKAMFNTQDKLIKAGFWC